jgi:hypothetical protein
MHPKAGGYLGVSPSKGSMLPMTRAPGRPWSGDDTMSLSAATDGHAIPASREVQCHWCHAAERLGCGRFVAEPGFFNLFLLGVGEACDEIAANLVIVPGRTGNGGVKTALVDGFIFGRVEHLTEVELAQLRRLPLPWSTLTPARVSAQCAWMPARTAPRRRSI